MPDEESQVCESITRSQRILMKGCITGGGGFFYGDNVMWHHPVQSTEVGCHAVIQYWMIAFPAYTRAETANTFRQAGQPSKLPMHRPNKASLKSQIISLCSPNLVGVG